jgi:DNA-binding transcriptional LysR family regulator
MFVRDGQKMVPTAMAMAMHAPVEAAIEQPESEFTGVAAFDPASSSRTFTILGADYFSTMLMPELVNAVHPPPSVRDNLLRSTTTRSPADFKAARSAQALTDCRALGWRQG